MTTRFYADPVFRDHDTGAGHPECGDRLAAIEDALTGPRFQALDRRTPPEATVDQLTAVHEASYVRRVLDAIPSMGHRYLDGDTVVSPQSGAAALKAAGSVCDAASAVLEGQAQNAFCAVRPPGHHATPSVAMGFCLFNNVAVAAAHAMTAYGLQRIAIVDFDVHHGNGTQDICWDRPGMLYISSHQAPLYPGTGQASERGGSNNIVNLPLTGGTGSEEMRREYSSRGLSELEDFRPELIFISAGFDAHRMDPLAGLRWDDEDYAWITQQIVDVANRVCSGRIVATLEGGYHLVALGNSVAEHVATLLAAGK